MRVLHCIYDHPRNPWVGGGGAVRTWEIYRRLSPLLREVTLVTGNFPGADAGPDAGPDAGFRVKPVGQPGPYARSRWTYARAATRLLSEGDYDVAIQDFSVYSPVGLPSSRRIGTVVHHLTGPSAPLRWGRLLGWPISGLERYALHQSVRAGPIAVPSRSTATQLASMVSGPFRVEVIPNGVPDALFTLPRNESFDLLFFGRLDWFQKGIDRLLETMSILAGIDPTVRLRMAGRGRDLDRVQREVEVRGLQEQVTLLGSVSDSEREALFAGARILLMPSRFEGFGMVAAEAMAAGLPVIGSDAGALPEVLDAPRGGVLVSGGDPQGMAHVVLDLLRNPSRRIGLGESARASAERFRWDRVAGLHLKFLESLERR